MAEIKGALLQRIGGLIRRGEITVSTGSFFLQFSGLKDEGYDDVECLQHYGFASRVPADAEGIVLHVAGLGELAVCIATNSRAHRPTDLAADEVVTYGKKVSAGQAQVRHKPDGTLALSAATAKFVEVGGNSDSMMMGTAVHAAMTSFFSTLAGAIDPTVAGAATAAQQTLTSWLSTKAKVG